MTKPDLTTQDGLRAAIEATGGPSERGIREIAETLQWVRDSDERTRATREFQWRLWEDNHMAAVGRGSIKLEAGLGNKEFRHWLAVASMRALPASTEDRLKFLTELYNELKTRLDTLLD